MQSLEPSVRRRVGVCLVVVLSIGVGGCATVQPWQRSRLAHESMTFDADPGRAAYDAHWQESREGAAGGSGVQSGGCGCK